MRLTTNVIFTLSTLIAGGPMRAQVFTFNHDQMIKYTAKNPFERFEDGSPKAPDALLEKCKDLSAEEVWAVMPGAKFNNQYEGNWQILHPEKKLVGRAVTAQFMPYRPDVDEIAEADAHAKGLGRSSNQRVIDMLQPAYAGLYSGAIHPTAEAHAIVADHIVKHARLLLDKREVVENTKQ